jgi:outer membrane receptor protein involved in Fe transport
MWSKGPITLGLNLQYYGSYSVDPISFTVDGSARRRQGAGKIGSQVTLDLFAAHQVSLTAIGGRSRTLEVRFGVQDLLDRRAAIVVGAPGGYSYYADPRRRRFEMTAAIKL